MAQFKPAFDFMLRHEDEEFVISGGRRGKTTHDENDRTRFGICEQFHPEMSEEFWGLRKETAEGGSVTYTPKATSEFKPNSKAVLNANAEFIANLKTMQGDRSRQQAAGRALWRRCARAWTGC